MWFATTRSKTVICIPEDGKFTIKTLCGKQIKNKVEQMARDGRFKTMKTCPSCAARLPEPLPSK